jgi:hypothetical protein
MSIVGSLTFQPYNPPLHAFRTMKVNLPMLNLTFNVTFLNNEGEKRLQTFVPERKSNSKKVSNFQGIQYSSTIFT